MKQSYFYKTTVLLLVSIFISVANYAQKGMNIQLLIDPGLSMGGKYQVPETPVNNSTGWVDLKKSFTFGLDAGVSFGYNFTDNMGATIGLLYSKQGQHYKDYTWNIGNQTVTWQRKVSLNYVKIPLQFVYILNPEEKISFTATAGVYLGFLVGYNDKNTANASDGSSFTATAKGSTYTQTDGTTTESAAFTNGKPYKSADFGAIIGIGIQYKLSEKISIPVGINYQIGFVDVKNQACQYTQNNTDTPQLFWQNSDNNSPNATLGYHNSSLELKIGLKVNL